MKLNLTLEAASGSAEHTLELELGASPDEQGPLSLRLDGQDSVPADWARLAPGLYSILLGDRSYEVGVSRSPETQDYTVRVGAELYRVVLRDPRSRRGAPTSAGGGGPEELKAAMPGRVVKLLVREGDQVQTDQSLLVMEAMKMQNELRAPRAGRVERIYVSEGVGVERGAPLVRLV